MSAARHVSRDQLRMFIPAGELADPEKTEHADLGYAGTWTTKALANKKVKESMRGSEHNAWATARAGTRTMYASIVEEGVRDPVTLSPNAYDPDEPPTLMQGHHRAFTAAHIDPKMEVPVKWWDPEISHPEYS